ncbi:MAG: N-formylglutamate deformylase [Candidimonas sp.]|nr:MAG: N-formylglutamate deformylase [Candidimonas sp.]TAM23265.1 MAG: N-formylglutamate deformylase [Candidimonas sp.]TAM77800.1 MAG: N-formylglutamate deformylase [Candidimonas sp.]
MNSSTNIPVFTLAQGSIPLLVSIPHLGTRIPDDIARCMTPVAGRYDDTDWHLDRLYGFAKKLGASILQPSCSRYVIDLNRPPDGASLYPGQDTTGLLPVDTFDKQALYAPGQEPDQAEQQRRLDLYWKPYHAALQQELARLKSVHGKVLLWEAHSIRSHVPRFFEGRLPDFNFGTSSDASAPVGLAKELASRAQQDGRYSAVANGRFKGGYITRHYGQPANGVYAVQLEQAQITYMDETHPYAYVEERANAVAPVVQATVEIALDCLKKGL